MPLVTATDGMIDVFFQAFSRLDSPALASAFTQDGVNQDPVGGNPVVGREKLASYFLGITGLFESLRAAPDNIFVSGDRAAVKWSAFGRGRNGVGVSFEGICIFEMDGKTEKIRRITWYWDPTQIVDRLLQEP